MTETQIKEAFTTAIQEKAIYHQLKGISEDKIYNWRNGRGRKPSTGEMLEVLYQLNLVKITANELNRV